MALAESERIAQLLTKDAGNIVTAVLFAKDYETKKHSERVAKYSREIAIRYGLTEEAEIITIWALLHDVGKIGIPEYILNKPASLTDEEYEIVKNHSIIGEDILKNLNGTYGDAAKVVRSHHERFDGQGYPYGIAGEDIPMEARIVAVADAYDEMMAEKVFAMPLSKEQAKEEIKNGSGSKFDPEFASIMLQIIDEEPN